MALNKLFIHFGLLIIFINTYIKHESQQTTEQYSLILKVYTENGKNYLDADYVQYLIGDKAIEEAKKNGDADAFIVDGKKIYAVPNDYYIVNKNKTIRKIELSYNPKFNLLIGENLKGSNTFENFKKNYHDTLYILRLKNNKIIEVKEVFIP
ncbi:MAG TPA: hypothetical protein DCM02_03610 [Flavobacterium sp.]|nr:hypothetical protein [Flavobacterium sp.]